MVLLRPVVALMMVGSGLFLLSCAGPEESARSSGSGPEKPNAELRFDGTVQYRQLEGGAWVIVSEEETTYDPTDLPEEYKEKGLAVRVWANRMEDAVGIRMVGPIISIQRIERK